MEWRQQTSVSCSQAFAEAQRWIQEVTGKLFGCSDFRAALENGVLLCDLINKLKPGIIKKVNRLSTPIAGLDNVNVFLKACGKLGLNESQLFHSGDLQDLSTRVTLRRDESKRRLKNVLITIYWLGRKAHLDAFYNGPELNFKAFEGLLGLALSKSLEEGSSMLVKDGGHRECLYLDREEGRRVRRSFKREDSVDSVDSLDPPALCPNSEGCGSDAEAEQVFRMETAQSPVHQTKGHIPAPLLRRKQGQEETGSDSLLTSDGGDAAVSPEPRLVPTPSECAFDEELFQRALLEEDSEEDYTDADPILDDLYFRRVQHTYRQTPANPDYDRFLPRCWTPEEEARVCTINLGSQRRPWYRRMQSLSYKAVASSMEQSHSDFKSRFVASDPVQNISASSGKPDQKFQNQVRHETPVQVNPGWIWSKSLSDIPMVYPVRKLPKQNTVHDGDTSAAQERKQDDSLMNSVATKDSDAQWQDDLTKWKIRRRSTKTDRRRKSLDRDHVINQMANGAVTRSENDTHADRSLKREQPSPRRNRAAPRLNSTSPSKLPSSDLRPHTRPLLSRSYVTQAPFTSTATITPHNSANTQGSSVGIMPASGGNSVQTPVPSLASDGARATTPTVDFPFSSRTQVRAQGSGPSLPQPTSDPTLPQNVPPNQISTLVTTLQPKDATKPTDKELPVSQTSVEDGGAPDAAGIYSFLSRTPSWSGSASLPRGYRRSEGSTRLSSAITARPFGAKQSRMSALPKFCSVDHHGSQLKSEKESTMSALGKSSLKRQTAATHLKSEYHTSLKARKSNQVDQNRTEQVEGMGSSIPTKINGFHHQPSTQTLPSQPHSAPQARHYSGSSLQTSAKVDHSNMRVSLNLKPNSVADFGFQTHWDSRGARLKFIQPGSPAELCQLCVDDEIVAVDGAAVAHLSHDQWMDKMTAALQTGRLNMDIRRYGNKDWSSSERSRLTQSRMTLNLTAAAPGLIGCPDHHANGTASTEAVALKFNEHTDNVKPGEVRDAGFVGSQGTAASKAHSGIIRTNQKRRAEFFRPKGGSESAISDLQVPSLSPSSSSWSWDHEEDRRRQEKWQEEQERLLQEQYQRDQERLEATWRRAQQDAMGDLYRKSGTSFQMTNGGHGVSGTPLQVRAPTKTSTEEEPSLNRDEPKESEHETQSDAEQSDFITGRDWAVESCGFAQLSPAHRAKSLSTSALAGSHKPARGPADQKQRKSQSKAELERQQILEEMKKRTQLLTDNSWIRQRSGSFYKEPIYTGAPLKRYESLDNLDTLRQSPVSASIFSYPRPHSAAGYCAPSRNSSSRYSTGSIPPRKYADTAGHHGSVWPGSDVSEELKQDSSFGPETGGPAVISGIHKSSTLVAPPCDQRAVLQITE